jgi:hypothetical protein
MPLSEGSPNEPTGIGRCAAMTEVRTGAAKPAPLDRYSITSSARPSREGGKVRPSMAPEPGRRNSTHRQSEAQSPPFARSGGHQIDKCTGGCAAIAAESDATVLKAGAPAQGYATDLWTLARIGKLIEKISGKR